MSTLKGNFADKIPAFILTHSYLHVYIFGCLTQFNSENYISQIYLHIYKACTSTHINRCKSLSVLSQYSTLAAESGLVCVSAVCVYSITLLRIN